MIKQLIRALAIATAATMAPLAQAQTTLDFPTWQAEEPGVSTWWKDLIAAYEKKYPDVKVAIVQVPFAQFIKQTTEQVLQVEEGSLYPALQRMLIRGWVTAEWRLSEKNRTRSSASTKVRSTGRVENSPTSCSNVRLPAGKATDRPGGSSTVSLAFTDSGGA